MDLFVADVNNAHRVTDWPAFRRFSPVVIAKMSGGGTSGDLRRDAAYVAPTFAPHRAGAAENSFAALGLYHFWVPGVPGFEQADVAIRALGGELRDEPLEFLILDVEGDTAYREHEVFCRHADGALGRRTWYYGGSAGVKGAPQSLQLRDGRPVWVARYFNQQPDPAGQPGVGETLWQFTDRWPVPGLNTRTGDCSVHRGDLASLLDAIRGDDMALTEDDKKWIGQQLKPIREGLGTILGKKGATDDDKTHDSIADALRSLRALADQAAAGGAAIDYDLLAEKVVVELGDKLAKGLAK